MELPHLFAEKLSLPIARYHTLERANISDNKIKLVGMDGTARTNHTSQVPVIGTMDFNPCTCLIVYNRKTKTAALTHRPYPDGQDFTDLLHMVRKNDSDAVDVHIIGASIETASESHDEANAMKVGYLNAVLEEVDATPNATVRTFDVYDKLKPHAVAIDTRNGKLIRGTELITTMEEGEILFDSDFDHLLSLEHSVDFDGTTPDMQVQRHR